MKVKNIEIIPVNPCEGLVAFASCTINDSLYLANIAIRTDLKNNHFRLVFPTKRLNNGAQIPVFNPINAEAYEGLRKAIVSKYLNLIGKNVEKCGDVNETREKI
ncbi:MAG: hypothetical protein GY853_14255 [PVC group bacterium]|nr:hypothetical protein [PVC group bacterium]